MSTFADKENVLGDALPTKQHISFKTPLKSKHLGATRQRLASKPALQPAASRVPLGGKDRNKPQGSVNLRAGLLSRPSSSSGAPLLLARSNSNLTKRFTVQRDSPAKWHTPLRDVSRNLLSELELPTMDRVQEHRSLVRKRALSDEGLGSIRARPNRLMRQLQEEASKDAYPDDVEHGPQAVDPPLAYRPPDAFLLSDSDLEVLQRPGLLWSLQHEFDRLWLAEVAHQPFPSTIAAADLAYVDPTPCPARVVAARVPLAAGDTTLEVHTGDTTIDADTLVSTQDLQDLLDD